MPVLIVIVIVKVLELTELTNKWLPPLNARYYLVTGMPVASEISQFTLFKGKIDPQSTLDI